MQERGAGVSRFSDPLPLALLTNAFANPLEVCAAGAISMTPSHLLLQRTSLYCAKIPASIVDDGGEVMATAIGVYRVSPPPVRSQPRASSKGEEKAPA